MAAKKPPVSVGRSKRKIIVESENYYREAAILSFPQDQFRKDYNLLWQEETLAKGSYGLSAKNPSDVEHPLWKEFSYDKYMDINFRFYSEQTPARLMRGTTIFENEENPLAKKTQVYAINIPHMKSEITKYDPLSDEYDPRIIRYIIPRGDAGPKLASLVYGTNAAYYLAINSGEASPDAIARLVVPTREEFVYDVLNGIDPGPVMFDRTSTFVDNLITMDAPYNVKGGAELDTSDTVFFDIKANFQYQQEEYIKAVTKTRSRGSHDLLSTFDEKILPSFYHVVSDYVRGENRFKKAVMMNGLISDSLTSFYKENKTSHQSKKPYMLKHREYFATYADILPDILFGRPIKVADSDRNTTFSQERILANGAAKTKNIAITTRNWEYLTDHGSKIEEFPIYNEISFRSEVNSGISQLFSDVYMDEPLIKTLISCHEQAERDQLSILSTDLDYAPRELFPAGVDFFSSKAYTVGSLGKDFEVRDILLNEFDFMSWLDAFKQVTGLDSVARRRNELDVIKADVIYQNASFIGEEDKDLNDSVRSKFLRTFMNLIGKSRIVNLAEHNKRDFFDILRGKPCYSETIVYKVCKHIVEEDGRVVSKPLQRFWISNNPNTELVKFYDTQVKFDAKYKYIVYAYKLVIGTKYKYVNKERTDLTDSSKEFDQSGIKYSPSITSLDLYESPVNPYGQAMHETNIAVQVEVEPTIKLIEVPYYGTDSDDASTVRMYDDPPLPPNIEIIPYVGVTNMFLLNLNSAIGRHEDHVKIIEPSDSILFEKVREYQERSDEEMVIFSNDDNPSLFEIYRIAPDPVTGKTEPPKDYSDFSGKLIQTIDGPHVSTKQTVKPNHKYYYTFRSIDSRGNVSNPSPVYEVEMVGNELMFPIVKQYKFPEKNKGVPIREARRFLYVRPNYEQIEVDATKSGFEDTATEAAPVLGVLPEEPLFSTEGAKSKNKVFKIRLTSKKSGKKIDFNVRFKHEHENFK